MRIALIAFILLLAFGESCAPKKKERIEFPQFNYIVVLDLSDRILVNGQTTRDKQVITSLYSLFLKKLKQEFFFNSTDKFKIVIPYQKDAIPNNKIAELENELYINVETVPIKERKILKDSIDVFANRLDLLYSEARISDNPNDYKGADIFGYIKNDIMIDMAIGENVKNFLFLVTDGYMYAEGKTNGLDDWEKANDLSNVEVIMLELNPNQDKLNEQELMVDTWDNWFSKMNAKSTSYFTNSTAISKIEEQLCQNILGSSPIQSSTQKKNEDHKEKVGIVELPKSNKKSQSSSILQTGKYISIKNSKPRTLEIITVVSESSERIEFHCSLLPLGVNYENLNGSFNLGSNEIVIEKLGTFKFYAMNDTLKIVSNSFEFIKPVETTN